jgi:two-component system, OmpR family, phosphate regulon sensor histidine kinase PhoR
VTGSNTSKPNQPTAAERLTAAARNVASHTAHQISRAAAGLASFVAVQMDPNPPAPPGRESVQRYRETVAWQTIVDALPAPAIALDAAGIVRHHNAAASELYPEITVGQPISHISRNPAFMDAVEQLAHTTQPVTVELIERIPYERRFYATLAHVAPREIAPGLPQALITFRDTTEQDKLLQMRTDFIANASHELRTPLSALRGFIETLQGPARDDPKARERFLAIMASQAERMTRLIDDLLSLSRAEMRTHLPPQGTVDLNDACASAIHIIDAAARAANATIAFNPLPAPALIRGERDEILQVLQNLLQNAIKYGRDGGHVSIFLTREPSTSPNKPDRLALAVADDGPGIAPEHLPRLTERFYRANVSSSREKGGTGLGLAIVKHIVIRHRGTLDIQSIPGKGSTFTISFDSLSQNASA